MEGTSHDVVMGTSLGQEWQMDVEDEYIAKDWDGQKEKGTDKQVLHQAQLEIGTYTTTKWRLTIIVNVLCKSSINEIQYRIFYPLRKITNNN